MKHTPLQHKILSGYITLVAVIASMAAILVYEREATRLARSLTEWEKGSLR